MLDEIIIPYVKRERTRLELCENQYALLILDVFKGQMTEPVTKKMEKNHILYVRVPANMTNLFQPLDLTVNGSFKALMKSDFTEWYSKEISKQLQQNVPMENIEIKLKVSPYPSASLLNTWEFNLMIIFLGDFTLSPLL